MSTSLLYHGFGIVGYRYIRTEYRDGAVIFTVSRKKFSLRCPVCKSKRIIKHGSHLRWFHSLPIGKKATYIKTEIARVECKDCKTIRQSDIGFADPRFTYTRALGRYVLDLARHMTIIDGSPCPYINTQIKKIEATSFLTQGAIRHRPRLTRRIK